MPIIALTYVEDADLPPMLPYMTGAGQGQGSTLAYSSPGGLPLLQAWYRADKGITLATGVSNWNDQSGSGDANRNLTQLTTSAQPTLNAADPQYNNQATVSFAKASSQLMTSGTWSSALVQPSTVFLVGHNDNSSIQAFFDSAAGVEDYSVFTNPNSGTPVQVFQNGSTHLNFFDNVSTPQFTLPQVFVGVANGSSSQIYINGGAAGATGSMPIVGPGLTGLVLGALSSGIDTLNGKIAELAFWNRILSSTEIEQLAQYAHVRYGISVL